MAEDPENWVKEDFKLWKDHGRHLTVASVNTASSETIANATWRQAGTTTTATTASEIFVDMLSTEEVILDTPAIWNSLIIRKMVLNKKVDLNANVVMKEDANSNLNFANDYQCSKGDGSSNLIVVDFDDIEFDNLKIQSNTVGVSTTTTVPKIGLKEEEIVPEMHAEIISNKELVSNLIVVDADDDNIKNAKLPLGCDNLIGDLDGIQDIYYQIKGNYNEDKTATTTVISSNILLTEDVNSNKIRTKIMTEIVSNGEEIHCSALSRRKSNSKEEKTVPKNVSSNLNVVVVAIDDVVDNKQKYGSICDRSDNINPPPLPPESPAYTIHIPCIHSNIPNN